jgi:mannosyl-oligosaccharide alpha-1,2-mannosidase
VSHELTSDDGANSFSWGASIIDTLDTLLIMGFEEEYNLCRPHVNQVNFNWVAGKDWSQGYKAPESEGGWSIIRSPQAGVAVFESGIRYLGGLLGAYDLSGDRLMLERATDIAGVLGRAFNTRSGLPQGSRIDPGVESGMYNLQGVSVAEVGSMTLEMIRLSQATGDRQWFDLAQRAIDFLDKKAAPRSKFKPLLPMSFSPDGTTEIGGSFSFGAMTDSYYEYLIKAYKLLGGGEQSTVYKRLYAESIDAARKLLFRDIDVVPNRDLFTIGKYENNNLKIETEHLSCFAGGMLALGAKLLDRPKDMKDAAKFTTTCYWIGAAGPLGIQPEVVQFYDHDDKDAYINRTIYGGRLHPPIKLPFTDDQFDHHTMYKTSAGDILWSDDHTPVRNDSGRVAGGPVTYFRAINGNPPGTSRVTPYYINRPETIESVFYM